MSARFIADDYPITGGAELSFQAIREASPLDEAEDADLVVIGNCTQYDRSLIPSLKGRTVVKVISDRWNYADPVLRAWLLKKADLLTFVSPLHMETFEHPFSAPRALSAPHIPLHLFEAAAKEAPARHGTVWLGQMTGPHYGIRDAKYWGHKHGEKVEFWGEGPYAPDDESYRGPIAYEDVPKLLAGYERLLFLPTQPVSCGRVVIEAYAAGCELVVNDNCEGALYWLDKLDEVENAAGLFWDRCASLS